MNWVVPLMGALGIPTILSTLVTFFVNRYYNKRDDNKRKNDNILGRLNVLEEKYHELSNNHEDDSTYLKSSIEEIDIILESLKSAQQALLRDRIIETYNHYYVDRKYMPIYARESLEHMYQDYKNLNGNGVIEKLIERLYLLPTDDYTDDD